MKTCYRKPAEPKKQIRLNKIEAFSYRTGLGSYLVARDLSAGILDRYSVFLLNSGDPLTNGKVAGYCTDFKMSTNPPRVDVTLSPCRYFENENEFL